MLMKLTPIASKWHVLAHKMVGEIDLGVGMVAGKMDFGVVVLIEWARICVV